MPTLHKLPSPSYAWNGRMDQAQVTIDDLALVVMDYEHFRVHQAEMYAFHYQNLAVSNDASVDILIAASALTHAAFEVVSEGLAYGFLYEAGTYSGGTAVTGYNRNREAALVGTAPTFSGSVKHTPTVTAVGTEIAANIVPGGSTPASAQGGGRASSNEWLLADGVDYLLRVTNKSGGAAYIEVSMDLYEDTHNYPGG